MKRFLGKSEKAVLAIVIFLALVGFILVLFWLVGSRKLRGRPASFSKQKTGTETGQENLPIKFAVKERLVIKPSAAFYLEIVPADELSALVYRLEVLFDPKALLVEEVAAGEFFENPQILRQEIDNEAGRICFSAGISPSEMEEKGEPKNKGSLATLFFKTKPLASSEENSETSIAFGRETMIIAKKTSFENLNSFLKPVSIIISR